MLVKDVGGNKETWDPSAGGLKKDVLLIQRHLSHNEP